MKPQVAFYWCASCGGCEEAVVDLDEAILDVVAAVDIVFWPVALDFKEKDVEAIPDGGIDICFINGAVRTTEQQRMALLLRAKSKAVVAFGACAQLGGIPALANLTTAAEILKEVGQGQVENLPRLFDSVFALDRIVPVDYYIPGCPPTPKIIAAALQALLNGQAQAGSTLAPDHALCEDCPRRDTRPADMLLERLYRIPERAIDPARCILAQGVPCLGPATRAGCEARCISGNMPCTGCFGPTSRVRDFGAKALSALASVVAATGEQEIDRIFESIPDPAGTFYRYSLPVGQVSRLAQPGDSHVSRD